MNVWGLRKEMGKLYEKRIQMMRRCLESVEQWRGGYRGDLLESGALTSAFGVRYEMMVHADALFLVNIDPALWEESVWVWEHIGLGLMENWGHADNGLGFESESDCDSHRTGVQKKRQPGYVGTKGVLTPAGISHSL